MKRLYGGGFGDCVRGAIASDATITAVRMPSSPFRHGRMRRKKYKGRYRIASARLRGYDYASAGWYHVVICTHERRPYFGQVRGGIVGLSAVGGAAHRYCAAIPVHADRAVLDAFIVMPNHVHAIIGLLPRPAGGDDRDYGDVETHLAQRPVETRRWHVSTHGSDQADASGGIEPTGNESPKNQDMADITPEAGSLSMIVNQYKGAVTRWARANGRPDFGWQARFYDRIIRDERERRATRRYVWDNPAQWDRDRNHPANM